MRKLRPRVPIGLPVAAVVLFVLGWLAGPFIRSRATEAQMASNVLLSALPFILTFAGIIIIFISLIWLVASALNHNIPWRVYRPIELAAIAGIVFGIFSLFQPWSFALYRIGFPILLVATLFFILWSHVVPQGAQHEELGSVSIREIEQG
jgi:uncharacterized membrane protein YfcA